MVAVSCEAETASITASATLYRFSLTHSSSWWPEGSRGNLDGCQDRSEHRSRLLPKKPLRRGHSIRTREEKVELVLLHQAQLSQRPIGFKQRGAEALGKRTQRLALCHCPGRGHALEVIRRNKKQVSRSPRRNGLPVKRIDGALLMGHQHLAGGAVTSSGTGPRRTSPQIVRLWHLWQGNPKACRISLLCQPSPN